MQIRFSKKNAVEFKLIVAYNMLLCFAYPPTKSIGLHA